MKTSLLPMMMTWSEMRMMMSDVKKNKRKKLKKTKKQKKKNKKNKKTKKEAERQLFVLKRIF
jgi:hypothetical protein